MHSILSTPIGELTIVEDDGALVEIHFGRRDGAAIARRATEVHRQLEQYFAGERKTFDLPLAPRGTAFQLSVWSELQRIAYGQTRSYADIARAIGRPAAVRAVGAANGANPIPIVIPCHRVIGSNGALTGFGGGIDIKRRLLDFEAGFRVFD
ncbi:MAG TPA: methylated-DNA--[protein]-cysteine S-methyltransferase [Thermoanaerobaculia bacterium]